MDKIRLEKEDVRFLLEWSEVPEHQQYVADLNYPIKSIQIELADKIAMRCIRIDLTHLHLGVHVDGKSIGHAELELREDADEGLYSDWVVTKKSFDRIVTDNQITALLPAYHLLMAYMLHGSDPVEKQEMQEPMQFNCGKKKRKRKQKPKPKISFVYILKKPQQITGIKHKKHASPQYAFGVRGHYRHYKSGKVVYIEPFRKGEGKAKDKNYKLQSKRKGVDKDEKQAESVENS